MENKNKFKQKTFKRKVMKTKNNVQKAVLRSVAVVVSFVLISFSVSGQNFWKKLIVNSGFDQIALAMVATPENEELATTSYDNELNYSFYQLEAEKSLEMESWMMDETTFDVSNIYLEQALEFNLEVEEWMMDETIFQPEQNQEIDLEVENWMTDAKVWSI